jgi:carbonic anhydrase/acetyltransferase-like protein (isoleucine patch superfamily)
MDLTACLPLEDAFMVIELGLSRFVVLPSVRIGAGAVVAAGSVATRDVPDNTLVAGLPARLARSLSSEGRPDPLSEGLEEPVSSRRFVSFA